MNVVLSDWFCTTKPCPECTQESCDPWLRVPEDHSMWHCDSQGVMPVMRSWWKKHHKASHAPYVCCGHAVKAVASSMFYFFAIKHDVHRNVDICTWTWDIFHTYIHISDTCLHVPTLSFGTSRRDILIPIFKGLSPNRRKNNAQSPPGLLQGLLSTQVGRLLRGPWCKYHKHR